MTLDLVVSTTKESRKIIKEVKERNEGEWRKCQYYAKEQEKPERER